MKFEKKQAVGFGNIKAVPRVTTELKMRLRNISFETDSNIAEAIEVMSACFPERQQEIKQFMAEEMEDYDLQTLQTYLIGGQSAIDMVRETIQKELRDSLKEGKTDD